MPVKFAALLLLFLSCVCGGPARAQTTPTRILSGVVVTDRNEVVAQAAVVARSPAGANYTTVSDDAGRFRLTVPAGELLTLRVEGKNINHVEQALAPGTAAAEDIQLRIEFIIAPIHESVMIIASVLDPGIERRNEAIYNQTLFSRDDQVFHTLAAGVNAGQHEGGGKSLEVRRFGFNLDHGGVGGGLKVLVNNVGQNHATQGHGQGYLGNLKSLTPELIQDVDILNGPFSAEYGDFSGLGVVHIRLRESLPEQFTARLQSGSFNSFRTFIAYSPELSGSDAFVAYEAARTDGPFLNPLRYRRDNLTGSYTRHLNEARQLGFKFNVGRNDFISSGQIPLDDVAAGRLNRFGFIDPDNGGRVRSGTFGVYYRWEGRASDVIKLDGSVSRSLFDLYSNFTFFLNDEVNGDEIQQHDSRLQESANAQYLRPLSLFGNRALFIAGGNVHASQIKVGLFPTVGRNPIGVTTGAHARVTNTAGYVQQAVDFLQGRLHLEGGLRYDHFRFTVDDQVSRSLSGTESAARLQPKASLVYTLSERVPVTLHVNYGRGIASQDARGVVGNPSGVKVSTIDFYQTGVSHRTSRFSLSSDLFFIDRSNEQVYIPDDGSFEFRGPSRAYGYEVKGSLQATRHLSFNAGITRVMNAFFRNTAPRLYVDGAPHRVADAALTVTNWRGPTASLRYRHTSSYRVDGADASRRAAGLDVIDFGLAQRLRSWVDLNFSIDNLTNKQYFETQNYFASRLRPGGPVVERLHGTPGYPRGVTLGLSFRFAEK